ncbi:outer membrane lipid asymmetry maintenance protein MlaD [Polymorphobacter megasporae]|uniref:outer membrane lipid asymmetry maintenance protein MlaD n=1 Tax=Glacieibacterium megasporae TaxID=2835787 RepID=UPI001C1DF65A|nr:outer membrane lipid asymmetry maintenance protein MlaD [Polymorphobacter megasporae]UAJ10016.1 outer membrane lipid asymmetry maintenance protein MlaD [Polymorphobacter megasporae]
MRALFKENVVESIVGLVVVLVAIWFVTTAYARTSGGGGSGYLVTARFPNSTGVSVGTDVRVSGIKIGTVATQRLDPKTFQAVLQLRVANDVKFPTDSSAAITSEGILGGSYISLLPGGDTTMLKPGDEITDTQGAQDLMGLMGSFINRSGDASKAAPAAAPADSAAPAK